MRQCGLRARPRRRYVITTDSKHGKRVAPNIAERNFKPEAPNRLWASDITYIDTAEGWLYLTVVLDLYSRRVIGWSTNDTRGSRRRGWSFTRTAAASTPATRLHGCWRPTAYDRA